MPHNLSEPLSEEELQGLENNVKLIGTDVVAMRLIATIRQRDEVVKAALAVYYKAHRPDFSPKWHLAPDIYFDLEETLADCLYGGDVEALLGAQPPPTEQGANHEQTE